MPRQTKPAVRDAWANAVSSSPDIEESVYPDTGFPAPAGVPVVPTRGEFNFEFNRYDRGLSYLYQRGVVDWDTNEDGYDAYDVVRDSNGKLYQLLGTATPGTAPIADPSNWALFHRPPQPMPGETFTDEIAAWRNAKEFRVTGKDHFGFDAGKIYDFREDWMDMAAVQQTASTTRANWFGRWVYAIQNNGGTPGGIYANGPWQADLNTHPWGPIVGVNSFGQSIDAVSIVELGKPIIKMNAAALVYEVSFSVNGASGPQTDTFIGLGLGDGSLAANRVTGGSIDGLGAVNYGAYLEANGGTNWKAITKPNGGASTVTNTGVALAKDAPHRYRIVIVGNSDSDDSTARVIHMLDSAIVANHTVSQLDNLLYPFIRMAAHSGEVCLINLGPLRIQTRLELGDVLL